MSGHTSAAAATSAIPPALSLLLLHGRRRLLVDGSAALTAAAAASASVSATATATTTPTAGMQQQQQQQQQQQHGRQLMDTVLVDRVAEAAETAHEFGALNTLLLVVVMGICIMVAYVLKVLRRSPTHSLSTHYSRLTN